MTRLETQNNFDSYAKDSNRKSRQPARIDGQCKQRDGNFKKEPKEMLEIKNAITETENAFDGLMS